MSDDGGGIDGGEESRGITEFTETTTEGLGSRLQGACWGICLGIILFIGAFPFLFWNEGRAVDRYEALNEAEAETVTVSGLNIDPANNGKVLHFTVDITNNGTELVDTTFGIKSLDGLVLRREADMYQWKEKVTTTTKKGYGGKKTTTKNYSYDKVWSNSLINSGSFKKPEGHQNPSTMEFTSTTITGNPITIGAYVLPESLKSRLNWYKTLSVKAEDITDATLRDRAIVTNAELYFANKMTSLNPTTTSNTSPNTSSGTRQYFVVAQTNRNLPSSSNVKVVYTSYNLNDAKAYMMKEFSCGPDSNYPQRMIVEVMNGVVQVEQCGACNVLFPPGGNPLKQCCKTGLINGESQLLENGYNKFWWGGEEIYTMVSAARNYVTSPYTLATWTMVNNNNPVVPCNQPPVSSPPTTIRPSTPPPAAVRPTLPTTPVTPITPNPTTKPTTAQPTPIPTQNPTTLKPSSLKPTTALVRPPLTGECVDTANYQDIYGGTCAEYESNAAWCGGYGTTGEPGQTPNDNCCVCIAKLSGRGSGEEEIVLTGGIRGRRLQSTTGGAPMIGDQRVSFSEVPPSTITIVGVQQDNTITAFVADNGEGGDVLLFKQGQWTSVQMYDEAEAANAATTWILRFVGFLAMSLGLYLIFRPIEVFADIIPCVGSIIGCGIIFMSIFISAFLSTITISIAWLVAQPKIGAIVLVVMLVVVGGCGFGYKKFKGRGKDDDNEEYGNEKQDKLGSLNDDDVVKVASTTIPTVNAAPEQPVVVASTLPVPSQEAEITVNATPEPYESAATVPQPYVP